MCWQKSLSLHVLVLLWFVKNQPVSAGNLDVSVVNDKGEPVAEAVVYARPEAGTAAEPAPGSAVIDQVDKEFVPYLTVVYQGAEVSFPNNDKIRHHVYSFSKANSFEIPLYSDQEAPPVTFANPGVVALGCNVHDWMSAYVFVSDTPYYSVTNDSGFAVLEDLPAGRYTVEVWHPRLRGKPSRLAQELDVTGSTAEAHFEIRQKKVWKAWRGDDEIGEGY